MKHFFKRIIPKKASLLQLRTLRWLTRWCHHPKLWSFKRRFALRAISIGSFCMFIPLPSQMLIATLICILCNASIPIAIAVVWITNPLTIPIIFYPAYKLGTLLINTPISTQHFEMSWLWLETQLSTIWRPLLLGCFISGIMTAMLSYLIVNFFWARTIIRAWKNRHQRKLKR